MDTNFNLRKGTAQLWHWSISFHVCSEE